MVAYSVVQRVENWVAMSVVAKAGCSVGEKVAHSAAPLVA